MRRTGLRRVIFGMTCRDLAEYLLAYLDDELPRSERRAFDRHLFWCKACRAYLESYRATVELARSLGTPLPDEAPEPVPEHLIAAVLAARAATDAGAPPTRR